VWLPKGSFKTLKTEFMSVKRLEGVPNDGDKRGDQLWCKEEF